MMHKRGISALVAFMLLVGAGASPALASQSRNLGALTVTVGGVGAPSTNTLDGGDGSFADPWQIGFSTPTSAFEVTFSGDTVTNCTEPNPQTGFTIDPFTSGDTSCSFQMASTANQVFGVRITFAGGNATSTVFFVKTGSLGGGGTPPAPTPGAVSAPAKYSGPEFSGLSAKGVMVGSSPRLEGKNLDEISSIEIGGKAASFTLDGDKALDLTLPAGLAPGLYDLVINSSAGKLTHINAIQVREPKKSFSITTRSVAKISTDQYLEHSLIASMQIPELNKVRCIVNASSLSMAKMMADRLCAVVKASNPNIETTVVVPRSTVSGDSVFARVIYGWN